LSVEALGKGQFLTMMQTLVRGVAFAPNDEQITVFLASRQAPALPRPEWLELPTVPPLQVPAPDQADAIG
jgi:hypothetical protein